MPGESWPPGFVRPDPEPGPHTPTLDKSAVFALNDGKGASFPTLDDYVRRYVALGVIENLDDLITHHAQLIGEIFVHWISTGQLACVFASHLAKNPRENRWLPIVQLGALEQGADLGGFISSQLDPLFENHEAAVLIFPDITTGDGIVALVNTLCSDPSGRWYWTDTDIEPDPHEALALIGLRWVLRTDASVNFVLGFANVPTMPMTRRSPFTALFLRVAEKKFTPKHREDGRVQVHLADLDSRLDQGKHDKVLELTKTKRSNHVESTMTAAARARVTFSVSMEQATPLCPSKPVTVAKDGTSDH